ncbi:MAG: AAA family ATPase [Candidatus Micrarchaeota archaeon]
MLWTHKYAPSSLKGFAGNPEAVEAVRRWASDAGRGMRVKPLLLHGAVGSGKTALAHALAKEMGWHVIETDASVLRDADSLQALYGASSGSKGLYSETRLILVDEVDAVSDRQQYSALDSITKGSTEPVMLIANDVWNPKLAGLRYSCLLVEMRKVNASTIRHTLESIAEKEGADAFFAEAISKASSGDLRSAINDFQASAGLPQGTPLEALFAREREENMFNAVRRVFKATDYATAVEAGNLLDTREFSFFQRWLEENIPAEYERADEVAEAFSWLSRADVFQGRIMRRQHWGFLRYSRPLSLAGVALSKRQPYHKFTKYSFPQILKAMGSSRKSRELMKSACRKAAGKMKVSVPDARELLPLLAGCDGMAEHFEFSDDEASLILSLYAGKAPATKTRKRKAA